MAGPRAAQEICLYEQHECLRTDRRCAREGNESDGTGQRDGQGFGGDREASSWRHGRAQVTRSDPAGGRHLRAGTKKKGSNRRLKMELGYQFKYPTFRQGYTAEIMRLERDGKLDIKLEPR